MTDLLTEPLTDSPFKNHLHVRCIFRTQNRSAILLPETRERLWKYMENISWEYHIRTLAIGGEADHIHFLLGLPSQNNMEFATWITKLTSAKWINDNVEGVSDFEWQKGYRVVLIRSPQVEKTIHYIGRQGRGYDASLYVKNEKDKKIAHDPPSFDGKYDDIDIPF